jgi:solute carrier family 25 phosphate transporter 3
MLCGLGGIISCGTTHTMVVPLDLVKCRIQVDPAKYKSVFYGFKVTLKEDGVKGLSKGWAPTFFGYSAQGLCKFGLYEVFKVMYSNAIGEENSFLWRTSLYLAASASAEFFADMALAPFEAAKVKIQTTPGFANTLREAMPKMYKEEGVMAFYKGLVPLWMRQVSDRKVVGSNPMKIFIVENLFFSQQIIEIFQFFLDPIHNDEILLL